MIVTSRLRFLLLLGLWFAHVSVCRATWTLPGVFGHMPGQFEPGRNWTSSNPLEDKGAEWSLRFSDQGIFKLMEFGLAYKFNYVWREKGDSLDPDTFFIERTLFAAGLRGQGTGPESEVVFAPEEPGVYKISLNGTASVQQPSLGIARLQLKVIDAKTAAVIRTITSADRKNSEAFAWNSEVELKEGQALALTLSSVNLRIEPCGHTSVLIKEFSVGSASSSEFAQGILPLDLATWRPRDPALVTVTEESQGDIRFDIKPGPKEWVVVDGPTITIPERDKFSLARKLFLSCEADAKNAEGIPLQIRAIINGKGYARNLAPYAYWDASLELANAEKFHGWTELEGVSSIPSDCSKLSFEIWLAVPKTGISSFSLRNLEFNENFTKSNLIQAEPDTGEGNIFFSDSGLMKVEFADAVKATDWSVKVTDENDTPVSAQRGGNSPAPLSVPLLSKGFYKIVASASYANGSKLEAETTAAVVGEPLSDAIRMSSRFGSGRVHGNEDIWKKSGSRWDWVAGAIPLRDWVLNADGSISPPAGWISMKNPTDRSSLWAIGSYPKWLNGPETNNLCAPKDWSLYEKLFETFTKANLDLKYFSAYNEGNACWTGSVDDFIKFNTEMAVGAHRGNPQVKVYGPCVYSIDMNDFAKYVKGGLFDALDGVNIHAYVDGTPPEDEFIDRVVRMCASLKEAGKGDMPVYLSEFGWNSPPGDWQKTVPEQTRAQYVARSLSLLAAQPVNDITYFCFQYITPAGCGYNLLNNDGNPTPAYAAYVNVVRWLSEIKRGDAHWFHVSPNINLVVGKAGSRVVGVSWTRDGEEAFQAPDTPLKITDMMGRPLPSGNAALKLSPSPLFFELPPTCQFLYLKEKAQLEAVPGSTLRLGFKGASSLPGIEVLGESLRISPTAKPGSYLFFGKTESGAWVGQPVKVLAPLEFKSLESEVSQDGTRMTEFAKLSSIVDSPIKATLTLDSGASSVIETKVSKGGEVSVALNVPDFENGARMKGRVAVDLPGAIPFRAEKNFDKSFLNTSILDENANGEVDWSRVEAIDISQWGPRLDRLGMLNPSLKEIAASDCSARIKTAIGMKSFHFNAEVRDDVHLQTQPPAKMWMEDSIQLGFDVDADKEWQFNNIGGGLFNGHRIVGYGIALPSAGGSPMVWRQRADCPGFAVGCPEPAILVKVSRIGDITKYDVRIPWSALGLKEAPKIGSQLGFSLVINDADKGNDRHELQFGGGTADGGTPENFALLRIIKN
jgi:hypothetical protein